MKTYEDLTDPGRTYAASVLLDQMTVAAFLTSQRDANTKARGRELNEDLYDRFGYDAVQEIEALYDAGREFAIERYEEGKR